MNLFNKMMVPAFAAALTLGAMTVSQAQNFTFSDAFTPTVYTSNTSGTGATVMNLVNGSNANPLGATTSIILANLTETTPLNGGPNTFNSTNGAYSDLFTLTDVASGTSKTTTITGFFSGTADGGVGGNAASASITNTVTSAGSVNFVFSTGTYTLSNFVFIGPGPNQTGAYGATVSFAPVPEPGSVAMLVGMGMTGAGFLVRRRRSSK